MLATTGVIHEGKGSLECRQVGTDEVEVADGVPLSYPRRDMPQYSVQLMGD